MTSNIVWGWGIDAANNDLAHFPRPLVGASFTRDRPPRDHPAAPHTVPDKDVKIRVIRVICVIRDSDKKNPVNPLIRQILIQTV